MERVAEEVAAEARRLRSSGVLPAALERDLEDAFASLLPEGARIADTKGLLLAADEASFIDTAVPVASRKPAGRLVKTLLRSLMSWYLGYLANQVSAFAASVVRCLHSLDHRLALLEARSPESHSFALYSQASEALVERWADAVVASLASVQGRICHAESGSGGLLDLLAGAGFDAYGVDPRAELVDGSREQGHEVRWEDALSHLRELEPESLGGLVLSGAVDRLDRSGQLELARKAASAVVRGGVVVVVGETPTSWLYRQGPDAVAADLAPGRPLHRETWEWLLSSEGMRVEGQGDQEGFVVTARRN